MRARNRRWNLVASVVLGLSGCSLAPKNFRDMLAPAPIVRARAVNLGEGQPDDVAIPALIARLSDPDQVVRMTANDALKKRTGRDFDFVPWAASADERQPGVDRWRAWWQDRAQQAAYPRDDQLRKVAAQPVPTRRKPRRARGQGGPAGWPGSQQSPPQPSSEPTMTPTSGTATRSGSG